MAANEPAPAAGEPEKSRQRRAFDRIRSAVVWLHRWLGLLMTLFLLVEAVTGSILAFEGPIGRWLDPPERLVPASESGIPALDLASLAAAVERAHPELQVLYFHGTDPDVAVARCRPRFDPRNGRPLEVRVDHIVLDAHTGRELLRLPQEESRRPFAGRVMPFIRDLHFNLALGEGGALLLFLVALAWTVDCFGGLFLTLPRGLASFWRRWGPSWGIRLGSSAYRSNHDVHRAGGLWLWLLWFAFAWSSVQLEQHWGLYDRIMAAIFPYAEAEDTFAAWPRHDPGVPLRMDWFDAQARGRELMAQEAARQGFRILEPTDLVHFADNGLYNYSVRTDRPFPAHVEETVFFDGDSGARVTLPGIERLAGDVVSDWLRALHMARDPLDYVAYRTVVCLAGLVLAALCVTGVVVWNRKRRARIGGARRAIRNRT
jgi:uncharacterized iron-regulated membrane protein